MFSKYQIKTQEQKWVSIGDPYKGYRPELRRGGFLRNVLSVCSCKQLGALDHVYNLCAATKILGFYWPTS